MMRRSRTQTSTTSLVGLQGATSTSRSWKVLAYGLTRYRDHCAQPEGEEEIFACSFLAQARPNFGYATGRLSTAVIKSIEGIRTMAGF